MNNNFLSREQTAAMRGIGILAIVLHNFLHWLGPMVKENEYTFTEHNVRRLMVEIAHPSWDIIGHLFSFFGHYGVPVFVFLSAFGLVKKYEAPSPASPRGGAGVRKGESAWVFIKEHWLKLFTMMVVGYAAFVLVDYMTPGPRHYEFWNVVGQLGMFSNLYAEPNHAIWPGPYWYFGLTLQLYIVYRLVLYPGKGSLAGKIPLLMKPVVLMVLALAFLAVQLLFEPESEELNWYRYNCMGNLPVFLLGILFTRCGISFPRMTRHYWTLVALTAMFMVLVFSMNYVTWMIAPLCVVVATVAVVKALPSPAGNVLSWVGGISSFMFVCHPITRKILIPIARRGDIFAGLLLYIVATIVLAMLFKMVMKNLSK